MAEYKVIQDIEAEDKLLGPLTLRQFIYAGIVAVSLFICYKLVFVAWWLVIPLLPHMILFGLLAAPFGKDQTSEIWLLAKIRFFLKPQIRIWDQSNVKQLVTITAPKKIERQLTDNLSQYEVRSRLRALADTLDSRGWAVKNIGAFAQPAFAYGQDSSERLVNLSAMQLPPVATYYDAKPADDILDPQTNATAQNIDRLMTQSTASHRQHAIDAMHQATQPTPTPQPTVQQLPQSYSNPSQQGVAPDYWFMSQPQANATPTGYTTFTAAPPATITPITQQQPAASQITPTIPTAAVPTAEEEALIAHIEEENARINPMHSHLKTIRPLSELQRQPLSMPPQEDYANTAVPEAPQPPEPTEPPMTPQADPDIIDLANNDDLDVATIARQANKKKRQQPDEVVITLH